MSDVLALARPEIVALRPYQHAAWDPQLERLHANELPWRPMPDQSIAGLNRYPEPQPAELIAALAELYQVRPEQVLVGRGSDEGIDLLTRAFCRAGVDSILVCPPTFGMYTVAARIQSAGVVEVPLRANLGYQLDVDALERSITPAVKLIYLCSPNNPTGNGLARAAVDQVLHAAAGRALVVLDEAYAEFSGDLGRAAELALNPHLVILRTLSKAHGLAGARVGTVLAQPAIVQLLRKIIPPYAMSQLTIEAALRALSPAALALTRSRVMALQAERTRMTHRLAECPAVDKVWPSDANFLLVEFAAPEQALAAIRAAGLIVRDFRSTPGLAAALRITIGSPEQNDKLLASLQGRKK
ncbi:MAG: histidinol-phosphate transaminase [Steroidobacteraceae bacterium]